MKYALAFLMFALSFSSVFASALSVQVSLVGETPAVGTNVSLMNGGAEFMSGKADSLGFAKFNVTDGSYFVLLRRYPYPTHVSLIEVKGNTAITLSIRQLISYANIYGQISGPIDFSNASVSAYSGGVIAKRVNANKNGYYMLSYLPEGEYDVVFDAQGFVPQNRKISVSLSDFLKADAVLKSESAPNEEKTTLSVPAQAKKFQIIEVSIMKGATPVVGASIVVKTPSGESIITTDSYGKARMNAADSGTYEFSYAGMKETASVVEEAPQNVSTKAPEQSAPPVIQQPSVPSPSQGGIGYFAFISIVLGASLIVGIAILAILLKGLVGEYNKGKGQESGKHGEGDGSPVHETKEASHHHLHKHKKAKGGQ